MGNLYWLFDNYNNVLVTDGSDYKLVPFNNGLSLGRTSPWSRYPNYTFSLDNDKIAIGKDYE